VQDHAHQDISGRQKILKEITLATGVDVVVSKAGVAKKAVGRPL
jgi:hypothetical protein